VTIGYRPRWPWLLLPAFAVVVGCSSSGSSSQSNASASSAVSCDVTSVADHVLPSVVTIAASSPAGSGTGSGEVIKSDGYILTNNHVIAIAANGGKVEVTFSDGTSAPATIVGRDVLTDLAVLKVAQSDNLKVIGLGSSDSVQVGQPVVAIGAPLGLSGTVTSGIVSAMDRTVEVPAEDDHTALLVSALQTDAAINPGNSGGALVTTAGEVIGIPTLTAGGTQGGAQVQGIGFAIPSNLARDIAKQLTTAGTVTNSHRAAIGAQVGAATGQDGTAAGTGIVTVTSGGPADRAGLRPGDIIRTAGGTPTPDPQALAGVLAAAHPGDHLTLEIARGTGQLTVSLTLGELPGN